MFGQVKNVEDHSCKHEVSPAFDLWYHFSIFANKINVFNIFSGIMHNILNNHFVVNALRILYNVWRSGIPTNITKTRTGGILIMGFLTGKTAIITGAGRAVLSDGRCGSIGYGIATAYAKEGANLVITGRNVEKLNAAKEELEKLYGIKVLTVQADVNAGADNEAVVGNVVKQAIDTFGHIDVLINNAQASASGVTLADHTTEQFNLALYSGLYAAFYYMKACYPYLKESQGSVINFASGAGLFGNYGQCAYAAAKEGIRGLTRVAATEWAKDNVNVNIVCPLAWTSQLEQFKAAYPDAFEKNVHTPPAGHFGDAELEIGRVCVQLASPDFKYMTGETVTLEGGMGQRP
jgi:NAD(P)-dependent dehydrogenase (short-subunit alcohol dehydrogenase family)